MEEQKRKVRFNTMAILLIIIFCMSITSKVLQNDTFYTIKVGEYILENGVTMQDPFSWHEGLIYTFPHWLYDVMISLIYNVGGQLGIYISTMTLCAILGLVIYLNCVKASKNGVISFILTIGAMYLLQPYIAARAQLFTFILYALTIYFIERLLENNKKRYWIALITIPIIIANTHAATFYFYFILYLPYIGEAVIDLLSNFNTTIKSIKIKQIQKKINKLSDEIEIQKLEENIKLIKDDIDRQEKRKEKNRNNPYKIKITTRNNIKYLIIIMIICMFTGLLTPQNTFEPYTHFFKLLQGNSTDNISEHLPLTLKNNIKLAITFMMLIWILMFTDSKIRLCDLFMLGGLIFLTFWSKRQESMYLIMCVPILARLITAFFNKYDEMGIKRLEKGMSTILGMTCTMAIVVIMCLPYWKDKLNDEYVNKSSYPVEASEWILANLDINEIKLYNEYNFGSYLLFKGIPVFIDSRCDLYTPEFNAGKDIFNDFLNISRLNLSNTDKKIEEYGFTHLILQSGSKLNIYLKSKPDKYSKIYEDNNFYIYEVM